MSKTAAPNLAPSVVPPLLDVVPTLTDLLADSPDALRVWVQETPVAQPRHRSGIVGRRRPRLRTYEAPKGHPIFDWKARIVLAMREDRPRRPLDIPLAICLDYRFPTPQHLIRRPKTDPAVTKLWTDAKPDLDNLEKATLDAGNGLWWTDDARIVCVLKAKRYAPPWDERGPGVLITAVPLAQRPQAEGTPR